jgi:hypothetical protein
MAEWHAGEQQLKWLGQVKLSADMVALDQVAETLIGKHLEHAAKRVALKQAEDEVEWAESEIILSGLVVGKNEGERKASMAKLTRTDAAYKAASEKVQVLESEIAMLAAEITGLETKATALRMSITGKSAILNFLGSTSA